MIQRIQSIWLFVSAVLMGIAIFLPFVTITGIYGPCADSLIVVHSYVIERFACESFPVSSYTLCIFMGIASIVNLVIIFLFNKRKLQIKLTHYSFILKLALLVVIAFYTYMLAGTFEEESIRPNLGTLFVVIATIFDWLAIKAIRKDEELVRSIDRIR